ncbi:hypothetical protein RUM43_006185 [Polyplax serrata]|uniref:ABC-type xenobiotic transporter n=1 Tax=Polyplax serrata TaxID=468196 RepID=A0AAN8RV77_POLSC
MDKNSVGDNSTVANDKKKTEKNSLAAEFTVPPVEKSKTEPQLSFFKIFKFASGWEKVYLYIGVTFSVLSGFLLPVIIIFYGEYTTLLIDRNTPNQTTVTPTIITPWFNGGRQTNGTPEDVVLAIKEDAVAFGIGFTLISILQFLVSFIHVTSFNYSAVVQISKLRRRVFKALLSQDISWFDCHNASSYPVKMMESLDKMQEGIGEKIGIFINLVMGFLISVTMAFFYGWKLTLVMLTCAPVLTVSQAMVCKVQSTLKEKEIEAYGKAGAVAKEVFSSIKTVMAFNGEKKEIERFQNELEASHKAGIRRGYLSGIGGGVMWFITYSCYAIAFWYGVSLILESRLSGNFEYTPSVLLITFYGVLVGAIQLGQSAPHLEAFAAARGAATSVFSILERTSAIDSLATSGKELSSIKGEVILKDVSFHYPSRPEVQVLKNVNLHIKCGEKVALVGASGSGKSTIIQLLQRFYDPSQGTILLDGTQVQELNVRWMRQQFGIVGQEPSLFATTIYENIKHGLDSATKEDIEKAAALADAHDFIMKLPDGYQTILGVKGSQISGGQKQRIAIARALIRNPKILLLDEPTSALDSASESKVEETLEKASKGRTTIVVTHKLSAIAKADRILVLSGGEIVEEGNHEALVARKGHYYKLLEMQKKNEKNDGDTEDDISSESNWRTSEIDALTDHKQHTIPNGSQVLSVEKAENQTKGSEKPPPEVLPSFLKILKYNKPEWWAILLGTLSTIIVGSNVTGLAVLFGELYGVLSNSDADYVNEVTAYYSGFLFGFGVVVGVATFLQSYMLNYAGVNLTSRFRKLGFAVILSQEASWFDEEGNQASVLCTKLSGDASDIQGATGSRIGVIVQSIATVLSGVVVGFIYSWKMTLMSLVSGPMIFFGMYYEGKIIEGQSILEKSSLDDATKISVEAISNIRTVASFGREQYFLDRYNEILSKSEGGMKVKSRWRGAIFALGLSATYLGYAIALWYGGYLVADKEVHYKDVIKVTEAILFGMWVLGQSLAFAPNFTQAKISASRLFKLINRTPKLVDGQIEKDENWKAEGNFKLSNVEFTYRTRPDIQVLRGLDLDISKGQSIALVGPSGCGKSTVIQLLQRLYDPSAGKIYIDNEDISSLKISTLRRQFGIVSQEPVLFDRTIAENIAYGDNSREVTEAEVISAAKSANIHDFIVSLPLGYETRVGADGGHLSGGQRQRVAIARALVRNPKVLLLDEATSALDAESESVVQATLDNVAFGRTSITVGHRLGAIKKADVIYRIDKGRISRRMHREKDK